MHVPGTPISLRTHSRERHRSALSEVATRVMYRSCRQLTQVIIAIVCLAPVPLSADHSATRVQLEASYQIVDGAIPQPLTRFPGDPVRGKAIVEDRERGNCLVCHAAPLPDRNMHGTLGPPLDGIGNRYSIGTLRLRVVDSKVINPQSVMPAYYKVQGLQRVLKAYRHKTILTAQEVEDVLAYLVTLEDPPPATTTLSSSLEPPTKTEEAVHERRSGYAYLSPDSQQLQNDDFANPGMLWVERGHELWDAVAGDNHTSCANCHGEASASMRGVRARYPRFDRQRNKLINLEQQINRCRQRRMRAPAYAYESDALLALTTLVGFHSRDIAVQVSIDGPARKFFQVGRRFFLQRRGQLDLACGHCHDQHAGQRLRGEVLSQGQSNGFPIYRQLWQTLGSSHRMFAWCNTSIRAEPFALGSDEYVNLELYMAWRARGLPVESPAVRR